MRFPLALPLLALSCALLAGCGVSFGDAPQGTEFFKSLTVTGQMRAGAPLTAAVSYEQNNPVVLQVKCELRQGKSLVKEIGEETVPLEPFGQPEATPFPGNFSIDFTVDAPGSYKVECYTPADEDNFILKTIRVGPRIDGTATPAGG